MNSAPYESFDDVMWAVSAHARMEARLRHLAELAADMLGWDYDCYEYPESVGEPFHVIYELVGSERDTIEVPVPWHWLVLDDAAVRALVAEAKETARIKAEADAALDESDAEWTVCDATWEVEQLLTDDNPVVVRLMRRRLRDLLAESEPAMTRDEFMSATGKTPEVYLQDFQDDSLDAMLWRHRAQALVRS